MHRRLAAFVIGAAFVAGCHSEPTAPGRAAADDAAQTLLHIADSLSAHGGTANEVGAYRGLAALLIGTGRLSTVTISVDGAPSEYLATAQQITMGCPPGATCTSILRAPIRSVIAWEKANPRRAVQLFTTDFSGESWAPPGSAGTMAFLDGAGAMYAGQSASHTVTITPSDRPCELPVGMVTISNLPNNGCTQAEFDVAFDGTLPLVPFEGRPDSIPAPTTANALPSHHLTMASQRVHGVDRVSYGICIDMCGNTPNPPGLTPPMPMPTRDSLTATLTATVGSDVTLTFTVKNTKSTPVTVRFNDGQQYDFRVWNDKGVQVWHWGADKGFTQALVTRTLAAGESMSYTERFTPPAAGSYRAMAYLTSASHAAVAFATVAFP